MVYGAVGGSTPLAGSDTWSALNKLTVLPSVMDVSVLSRTGHLNPFTQTISRSQLHKHSDMFTICRESLNDQSQRECPARFDYQPPKNHRKRVLDYLYADKPAASDGLNMTDALRRSLACSPQSLVCSNRTHVLAQCPRQQQSDNEARSTRLLAIAGRDSYVADTKISTAPFFAIRCAFPYRDTGCFLPLTAPVLRSICKVVLVPCILVPIIDLFFRRRRLVS